MIWRAYLSRNLKGTLLAICDLGKFICPTNYGGAACDLRFGKFIEGGRKGAREREVEWEK